MGVLSSELHMHWLFVQDPGSPQGWNKQVAMEWCRPDLPNSDDFSEVAGRGSSGVRIQKSLRIPC